MEDWFLVFLAVLEKHWVSGLYWALDHSLMHVLVCVVRQSPLLSRIA